MATSISICNSKL